MGKFSKKFKLKVVKYCIEKNHSYRDAAKHFNLKDVKAVSYWVSKYQMHGIKGLEKNKQEYDGNFKQAVVEYMHDNHLSLRQTAIKFNLSNHSVIGRWEHTYYEKGPQALYQKQCGKILNMKSKPKKDNLSKEKNNKELLEEIEQLRMENAYLKKLQALIQQRTKPKQ